MTAMDMTRDTLESHLMTLKPTNIVFYDFAYWMPELGCKHGFKAVHYYITGCLASYAAFALHLKHGFISNLTDPLPGLESPIFRMRAHEAKLMKNIDGRKYGVAGKTLAGMLSISFRECDAFGVKTCKEMDGAYAELMEGTLDKPLILSGPVVPKPPSSKLDEYFDGWLNGFGAASVIYCALGSECLLQVNQFEELILGQELTGI